MTMGVMALQRAIAVLLQLQVFLHVEAVLAAELPSPRLEHPLSMKSWYVGSLEVMKKPCLARPGRRAQGGTRWRGSGREGARRHVGEEEEGGAAGAAGSGRGDAGGGIAVGGEEASAARRRCRWEVVGEGR